MKEKSRRLPFWKTTQVNTNDSQIARHTQNASFVSKNATTSQDQRPKDPKLWTDCTSSVFTLVQNASQELHQWTNKLSFWFWSSRTKWISIFRLHLLFLCCFFAPQSYQNEVWSYSGIIIFSQDYSKHCGFGFYSGKYVAAESEWPHSQQTVQCPKAPAEANSGLDWNLMLLVLALATKGLLWSRESKSRTRIGGGWVIYKRGTVQFFFYFIVRGLTDSPGCPPFLNRKASSLAWGQIA